VKDTKDKTTSVIFLCTMIGLLVISVLCFLGVHEKMLQTDSLDPSESEYPIL